MPSLRYHGPDEGNGPEPEVLPFPQNEPAPEPDKAVSDVLDALASASRRMEDLAKALGCLGYFDDDDDRPRAA